ncbi:MAG: citrate synthase [Planctomycetota bacterium]
MTTTASPDAATHAAALNLDGKTIDLPVTVGSEGEHAVDITKLRAQTGYITLDPGYRNTGSVESAITFIDGEKGILRHRGYAIEDVADHCSFIETAWLLIYGELPTADELAAWDAEIRDQFRMHEAMRHHFNGFAGGGHPMAILSALINAASCYYPNAMAVTGEGDAFRESAARLIAKTAVIAAASYKVSVGERIEYPRPDLDYCGNFLHMMFRRPHDEYHPDPDAVHALNVLFNLHADHEQNCSTSTVRMVGSSGANLFASCSAGVCALWGPLHGGANVAVVDQLQRIHEDPSLTVAKYVEQVKNKEALLFGFGHAVYRNFDPRANVLKKYAAKILDKLEVADPMLDIARELEAAALDDPYFAERKLYPNVDFYSGIILRALRIPTNMFTVMFAIGRMPGWIAQWKEVRDQGSRIYRPRQVYTGPTHREFTPLKQRG